MTPDELAERVGAVVAEAQARITGIGAAQYAEAGKPQKFETMPLDGLRDFYREELLDIINYAAMTIIRLDRIAAGLSARLGDVGYDTGEPPRIGPGPGEEWTPSPACLPVNR